MVALTCDELDDVAVGPARCVDGSEVAVGDVAAFADECLSERQWCRQLGAGSVSDARVCERVVVEPERPSGCRMGGEAIGAAVLEQGSKRIRAYLAKPGVGWPRPATAF